MTVYHFFQNMGLIALLLACIFAPQKTYANNGYGSMGAVLFDPLLVGLKEAKRFCEEEPQAVKCDILLERLNEKERNNAPASDALATKEQRHLKNSYNILSANFQ